MPEQRINVTIEGLSALLYHKYQGTSVDPQPVETDHRKLAERHLHLIEVPGQESIVHVPGRCIQAALTNAGTHMKSDRRILTTSRSSLVPMFLHVEEEACPLIASCGSVVTLTHGWRVDSATVISPIEGGARVTSYRPMVDRGWTVKFTIVLHDKSMFNEEQARKLVDLAGKTVGLLAWRPQKRGPYGKFAVFSWSVEGKSEAA